MHPHFSFVSSVLFYVSPAFFYASSVLCFRFLRALLSFPPQKRGPGPAMAPLPRSGPQRSGHSASTMLGVLFKRRHPPCRGDRGGSMSFWPPPSAPWSLDPGVRRENDERDRRQTRPLSRFSDFRHAFYVSSALSLVSPAKAGAQEPRWCRCHGADLSAAAFSAGTVSGLLSSGWARPRARM